MVNKWIFPLSSALPAPEAENLKQELKHLLKDWNRHGEPIVFEIEMLYHQVVIIKALSQVSGCAIDDLHRKVYAFLHQKGLELLPNHYVLYLKQDTLHHFDYREVEKELKNQNIHSETLILDKQKILEGAENPFSVLSQTWLVRYC